VRDGSSLRVESEGEDKVLKTKPIPVQEIDGVKRKFRIYK